MPAIGEALSVVIKADDGQFKQALGDAAKGLSGLKGRMADFNKELERISPLNLRNLGIAAVATGGALVALTARSIAAQAEVANLSERFGVAVEDLSGLSFAATQSDIDLAILADGLKYLSRNIGGASEKFEELGIQVKDRGLQQVLGDVADVFSRLPDGPEKAALAMDLFGRSGEQLIPLLNLGKEGLAQFREEAERLGLVMNEETAKQAKQLQDDLDALKRSGEALGQEMASRMLPSLSRITKAMREAAKESGVLKALFVGLGGLAAESFGLGPEEAKQNKEAMAIERRRQELEKEGFAKRLKIKQLEQKLVQEAAEAQKKATADSIRSQISDYEKLREAIKKSIGDAIKSIDDYRAKAQALRREAGKESLSGLDQEQIYRRSAGAVIDLIAALDDLERMSASPDASLDATEAQYEATGAVVERLRELSNATEDSQRQAELSAAADHYAAQAKLALADAYDREAEREQQHIQDLSKQEELAQQQAEGLKAELAAIPDSKTVTVQAEIEQARQDLALITAELAKIQDKTVTVTVNQQGGATGHFASGGMVRGPGSDTSDNLLSWLSPGEFVVRAAAVRRYGVDFLSDLNRMRLSRFASGGLVGGPIASANKSNSLQPITLVLPGIGSYPVQASPDVARELRREITKAALKRGS